LGVVSGSGSSELRFKVYVEALSSPLGHADRAVPFPSYCTDLLRPGPRQSVEPMAACGEPGRLQAAHQSLHHLVAKADGSDEARLAAVRQQVMPAVERPGAIRGWMIDETGVPKTGTPSVGVARQDCGQRGQQATCQGAVSLSVANAHARLPLAYRLYLPAAWVPDRARRSQAGVPEEIALQTKPQIARAHIRAARDAGVAAAVGLTEAGYGVDTALRDGVTDRGLAYVVGIPSSPSLWPPGREPLAPKPWRGRGRPTSRRRRDAKPQPVSAQDLAGGLPKRAWRRVTGREASHTRRVSRVAAGRVRPAHRDDNRATPRPEEGCLIEGPVDEPAPTKYGRSTLPAHLSRRELVGTAKLRWRIERAYHDRKQALGRGHSEGRGWQGFHHPASLGVAAYGFPIAEPGALPPSAATQPPLSLNAPGLPERYRPRGSPDPA
jgi:SRSO17 transposase